MNIYSQKQFEYTVAIFYFGGWALQHAHSIRVLEIYTNNNINSNSLVKLKKEDMLHQSCTNSNYF